MRPNIGEHLVRLQMGEIHERVRRLLGTRPRPARPRPHERDPEARPPLDTLDDWILFGPRMH